MRKDYVCANMARAIHEMPLRRRGKLRSVPIWEGSGAQAGDHAGSPLRYNTESGKRFKQIKIRGVYVDLNVNNREKVVETAQTFRKRSAEW